MLLWLCRNRVYELGFGRESIVAWAKGDGQESQNQCKGKPWKTLVWQLAETCGHGKPGRRERQNTTGNHSKTMVLPEVS